MNLSNNIVTKDVLASKGIRFANYIIDYIVQIILGGLLGVLLAIISELTGSYTLYEIVIESESRLSDYLLGIFILLLYFNVIETFTGRSVGKFITKTKVVTQDGLKPTFDTILVRTLSRIIPFEQFSFLGEDSVGWHDSLSKTYVVDIKKFEAKTQAAEGIEEIGKLQS
jgi:uncharacterized RDD family membrane protein YckC